MAQPLYYRPQGAGIVSVQQTVGAVNSKAIAVFLCLSHVLGNLCLSVGTPQVGSHAVQSQGLGPFGAQTVPQLQAIGKPRQHNNANHAVRGSRKS